jgi:aspartyl-tRNA(Asn)/glutamyl-tRNA(Gln) amidotransferase subunit A
MGFPPRRLRVAVSLDLGYAAVDPEIRAAVTMAAKDLANAEISVEFCELAIEGDCLETVLKPIALTEQAAAAFVRSSDELAKSDRAYRDVIEQGRKYLGTDYIQANYRRAALRETFRRLFEHYDLLITPTVATTAFAVGELGIDEIDGRRVDRHLGWSPFSWPMNLTGLPAATVPCGFDCEGLPIGMQIVGPWLGEERILHLASLFEAIRPWQHHMPAIAKMAARA